MAISFVIMVFFLSFRNEPKRWHGSMTFTDSIGNPDHAVKGSSTYLPNAKARSATASAATDDNADDNADDANAVAAAPRVSLSPAPLIAAPADDDIEIVLPPPHPSSSSSSIVIISSSSSSSSHFVIIVHHHQSSIIIIFILSSSSIVIAIIIVHCCPLPLLLSRCHLHHCPSSSLSIHP